jgi:hypothetical protein
MDLGVAIIADGDRMHKAGKEVIVPVHTRSAMTSRAEDQPGIRTDASLRMRGPVRSYADSTGANYGEASLDQLMRELRKETSGYPLTAIVHGWGLEAAKEFFHVILSSLEREDALWLVLNENLTQPAPAPAQERTVLLDLNECSDESEYSADRAIYNNLIGDIVFLPAVENAEERYATGFKGRARMLILHSQGRQRDQVVRAAWSAGLSVYLWLEGSLLQQWSADASAAPSQVDRTHAMPDTSRFGPMLKQFAEHVEREMDRRREFRLAVEKLIEEHPGLPEWPEELVRIADRSEWPSWAIQSLPSLYVTLGRSPDDEEQALVWHRIYDCFPEVGTILIKNRLCEGQFLEIVIPKSIAPIALEIAQVFEEHRNALPYTSERSFMGAVNNAMLQVETMLEGSYPDSSKEIREKRGKMLKKEQVITGTTTGEPD